MSNFCSKLSRYIHQTNENWYRSLDVQPLKILIEKFIHFLNKKFVDFNLSILGYLGITLSLKYSFYCPWVILIIESKVKIIKKILPVEMFITFESISDPEDVSKE